MRRIVSDVPNRAQDPLPQLHRTEDKRPPRVLHLGESIIDSEMSVAVGSRAGGRETVYIPPCEASIEITPAKRSIDLGLRLNGSRAFAWAATSWHINTSGSGFIVDPRKGATSFPARFTGTPASRQEHIDPRRGGARGAKGLWECRWSTCIGHSGRRSGSNRS